jgi:ABC-2 type transport system permease protein
MTTATSARAASVPRPTAARSGSLVGAGSMLRLALRRDRVRAPVWVLAVTGLLGASVASVSSLYPGEAERQVYAATVGESPVAIVMGGPGAGLPALGAIVVFEMAVTGFVVVGLMSLLTVVRHTRGEEEAGRTELLRSAPVGRYAGPVAALVLVAAMNALVGLLLLVVLVAAGLPVGGSLALSGATVLFGVVMAAVAAVAAQLSEHARAAGGAAAALLGLFFAVRAAGDLGDGTLSWASPMGWALGVRPFAGERWWALLLPAVLAAALVVLALALVDRRDVGAGLVPARPGRARASWALSGTLGLATRLHRTAGLGWAAGLLLLGIAYGSVGETVQDLVADNEALAAFIAASGVDLVDAFFAVAASMIALAVGGFAVQVTLGLRTEEEEGRLEAVLATAVPRWRWVASHLVVAVVGSLKLLVVAGLGMGATHAAATGDPDQVLRLLGATLVHAPAVWVLVGVATALFGLVPRAAAAAWAVLAASVAAVLLGTTLQLPGWALDLVPFTHVPAVPSQDAAVLPLVVLTAVAAALVGVGVAAFARRDVG